MSKIEIKAGELGTTRVFALSATPTQARALRDKPEAQLEILGIEVLNLEGVELFPLTDLGELGLIGYLREGTDARDEDLKRDATKLAALDGWVMLVHSLAFGGGAMTLDLDPALTLIGTYAQTPANTPPVEIQSESAKPYSGALNTPGVTPPARRRIGSLVVAILIFISALILWWALA